MRFLNLLLYVMVVMLYAAPLWAHGVVGKRFFPASLAVHDPFPADEMTLFAPSYIKDPGGKEISSHFEIQKLLSLNMGISIGLGYLNEEESPMEKGFNYPEIAITYAMSRSPEHEFIASTALGLHSEPYRSNIVPAFLFGKGLGNLPDPLSYLRPFALTGSVSLFTPMGKRNGNPEELASRLEYGLVIEYSIPYLQSFVKDAGIPRPFNKMFPIIELTYENPISGPDARKGTGFLNPGIVWAGKYVACGIEAKIPLNDRTGDHVGVAGLIHLFLDDIYRR